MSLGDSIRKNTAWILAGGLVTRTLQFIVGIVLARILVPEDFGLLVTIQIFTGALGFVAGGGMGQALVQSRTVDDADFKVVFTAQLLICTFIFAGLFFNQYFTDDFGDIFDGDLPQIDVVKFLDTRGYIAIDIGVG